MVVRGPSPALPAPACRAEGPGAPHHCLPRVTGTVGGCWVRVASPTHPWTQLSVCRGCAGGGQGQGQPRTRVGGGFSTFLYLCNQREEKFLWLFLRMVCSQDLECLFHQQPFASFPGGTRDHDPSALEGPCQAALPRCAALPWPVPMAGQPPAAPRFLPCTSTRVLVPPSPLGSLSPAARPPLPSPGIPPGL